MDLQANPLQRLYLSLNPDHDRKRDQRLLLLDGPGEPFELSGGEHLPAGSPLQAASLKLARQQVRQVFDRAASLRLGDGAPNHAEVQAIWTRSVKQSHGGVRLGQLEELDNALTALQAGLRGEGVRRDSKQPAGVASSAGASAGQKAGSEPAVTSKTTPASAEAPPPFPLPATSATSTTAASATTASPASPAPPSARAAKTQAWVNELLTPYAAPGLDPTQKAALRTRFEQLVNFTWTTCPAMCADNVIPQPLQEAAACLANDAHCPPASALYRCVPPLLQPRIISHLTEPEKLYTGSW